MSQWCAAAAASAQRTPSHPYSFGTVTGTKQKSTGEAYILLHSVPIL